ncbi:probable chitinase 10 [Anopheles stephensi]|uniref:Chitin-binding type-2 domain-containing protein n=1 Tax=Anopheles stephensi TaxID=30069 RepID=A0A182YP89_ANOST|nr:probable chitinase 10 [Anopheles stephensi]
MIVNLLKYPALGLVLIASILAEPGDRIPNHPDCTTPQGNIPVYLVHPTNCSRFYECKGRDAWEFECPAGLHFNSRINVCDYPAIAQCEGQSPVTPTNPTPTPVATTTTATGTTPATSTTHPASTPPVTGDLTTTTQQPGTTHNPTTTEGPSSAGTTAEQTSTTNNPTTTEGPSSAGTTAEQTSTTNNPTTTVGTSWDDTTTTWHPDTTPDSYTTTTSAWQVTTTTNPNCPPPGSAQPNYYPDSTDCSKYMGCQENCVQHFQCPAGLYWNDLQKRCDTFANSQCTCPIIPPAPNA